MTSYVRLALAVALLMTFSEGCRHKEKFPALGTAIVSPVDLAVSDNGAQFYVLNADMDRTYNAGSILVLDKDGNKLNAVEVPRMGRSLTVAGNDMLVSVDFEDLTKGAQLLLFNLDDPTLPRLVTKWDIGCSPFNAVMTKGYEYFAFTCVDGQLYIGDLKPDRSQSELHHVRSYGYSHRAMHLDAKRKLLFGFPTDAGKQNTSEISRPDVQTHDEVTGVKTADVPNEIPDDFESDQRTLTSSSTRSIYQFIVYDIDKEAALGFPDRIPADTAIKSEFRWLYFNLANFDGTPDGGVNGNDSNVDAGLKYYRTNFWSAQPDPANPNVFYLSHRGPPVGKDGSAGSPYANDVVKVSIVGDPHAVLTTAPVTTPDPKTGEPVTTTVTRLKPLPTTDYLTFERVYGFKERTSGAVSDIAKYYYPSDFRISEVNGQKVILVNNFRDLVNWVRKDTYFSLTAATLDDESLWFDESCGPDPTWQGCSNTDPNWSWFQVAVNHEGRALSCSFYGNAVMLLDVRPGLGIKLVKRIQ